MLLLCDHSMYLTHVLHISCLLDAPRNFSNDFPQVCTVYWSRGSSGSIVSDYGLDDRAIGFDPRQGQRIFPLASVSRPALGAHPASCTMGTGGPFPGSKARPGRDADHLPPSSAEVVNE
jgi:hypothetical protein